MNKIKYSENIQTILIDLHKEYYESYDCFDNANDTGKKMHNPLNKYM